MSNRTNAAVAGLVMTAVAAVAFFLAMPSESPSADEAPVAAPSPATDRPAAHKPPARAHAASDVAPAAEPTLTLPAPADLAVVDRDLDLHGVVVTKDGRPVAGASLRAVWAPWARAMQLNWEARDLEVQGPATKSAADGSFRLRLARGQDVTLRADAAGFASVGLPHRLAGERVRVVLEPGVRLVVRAIDEAGGAVAGVPVRAFRSEWQGDATFRKDGVTGADGRCAFDGLPPACAAYVEARPAGCAPVEFLKADLPAKGEATVEMKLVRGRTLHGRVVDAASGAPVADARVGMGWTLFASVATAADGTFVLPGWSDKVESEVHVVAAGHARAQQAVESKEFLEFALDRGFETAGRIVDAAGAPVGGALVSVIASVREGDHRQRMSMGNTTSGADGRFRVADLDRALPHRLIVVADGHARIVKKLGAPPADGPLDAGDVTLPAPRTIAGRVVSSSGEPIARMPLELWGPDDRDYFHYGFDEDRATDDLGRFRFTDLAPGGYQLSTKQRGASETVVQVQVAADADPSDVVVTVDAGTPIVATVVDEAGAPVAGVYVMAWGGDGMSPGAQTDATGVARLTVRGKGLHLRASCSLSDERCLLTPPAHDLADADREVRFVMKRGAKLGGTIVDPDGKPLAGALIQLRPSNPAVGIGPADDAGRFSTTVETGRAYAVVFDGQIQRERMSAVAFAARADDVAAGTTDLVLRCERVAQDRTLTVRALLPDGSPAAGARVMLVSATGAFQPAGAMTAEGRVAFAALPAKELSLMAWPTGDWLGPVAVPVTPAGQEVTVTMRRALPIVGTVVLADGTPVKGADARASTGATMHQGNDTKQDGTFHLLVPADDPGPFRVDVQLRSGAKTLRASAENVTAGGEPLRIVLDGK